MKKFFQKTFAVSLAAFLLVGCGTQTKLSEPLTLDESVSPTEDFYGYVNNRWLAANPLPADKSQWSTIHALRDEARENVIAILAETANNPTTPNEEIIGKFFAAAMNENAVETAGAKPVLVGFERISKLQSPADFSHEIGLQQRSAGNPFFSFWVGPDLADSDTNMFEIWQDGLGLPDRDYYLDDEQSEIREKYRQHVAKMFELTGEEKAAAEAKANTVLALETKIAKASRSREATREVEENYNKMTLEELESLTPNFDWPAYFEALGIEPPADLNVGQPEFFEALNKIIGETPAENLQTYLAWHWLNSTADFLSSDFVDQNFDFYSRTLSGKEEMEEREKRVVDFMNYTLGEAIGRSYAEQYFPPEAKTRAEELVRNLLAATAVHIDEADWMTDETKESARKKLAKMNFKIGYPDKWRDYSELEIGDNYFENALAAVANEVDYETAKIGQPVDKKEWHMSPQTVNAYFSSSKNEIVFPAAILQSPLFDANADDAMNYGGIGSIIGHEITHAFDDQGSKFDGNGELNEWWTDADRTEFEKRAAKLVEQFDAYAIPTGEHVNGQLTLGENIADLGGVGISFTALQSTNPDETKLIDGLTPNQRFFVNFARNWRSNTSEANAKKLVKIDVHSPMKFRVVGPITNFTPFYEAFAVDESSPIWRAENERVKIW